VVFAHGGIGLVTPDGKLHGDDPKVKEAAIKTLSSRTIRGGRTNPTRIGRPARHLRRDRAYYFAYNPAYAEIMAEHTWNVAWADIVTNGMKTSDAVDKALKRIQEIWAKYPISRPKRSLPRGGLPARTGQGAPGPVQLPASGGEPD
jgi:hypothetical protein